MWVTTGQADEWIDQIIDRSFDSLAATKFLRKNGMSASRSRLVVEQATLRPVARKKFSRARKMFFERTLLEQATDERLASYKAHRFGRCPSIVDVCTGLGGDLISLADTRLAVGVDAGWLATCLAEANCRINGVEASVHRCQAQEFAVHQEAWVHVDPDRRVDGRRSTTLDRFSPDTAYLHELVLRQRNVAIKLAPATRVPDNWQTPQRQWLGDRQECKQQIAWFGETVDGDKPKAATAIDRDGSLLFDWKETSPGRCCVAENPGEFLYEPHATIIAGRMIDSLANHFDVKRLDPDIQYLTGSSIEFPGLTRFLILDRCRMDPGEVSERLASFDAGQLEIKKRGVENSLMDRFAKIKLEGGSRLTLVLTRHNNRHIAFICKRMEQPEGT